MTYIATLITNPSTPVLSTELVDRACELLDAGKPDWLTRGIACDILVNNHFSGEYIKTALRKVVGSYPIDIIVQSTGSRCKKALIADMDSTMIEQECIDELADWAGMKKQVARITELAMNGKMDFEQALRERVSLLAGLDISVIDQVMANRITLTPGGEELIATMKMNGAWCVLVSGGFTIFTNRVAARLGFNENRANVLLEENGKLTGEVALPALNQQAKVSVLHEIAAQHSLSADDFITVGDGANDLGILKVAGTGVAFHARPIIAEQVDFCINYGDLTALLYVQGYRQCDFFRDMPLADTLPLQSVRLGLLITYPDFHRPGRI